MVREPARDRGVNRPGAGAESSRDVVVIDEVAVVPFEAGDDVVIGQRYACVIVRFSRSAGAVEVRMHRDLVTVVGDPLQTGAEVVLALAGAAGRDEQRGAPAVAFETLERAAQDRPHPVVVETLHVQRRADERGPGWHRRKLLRPVRRTVRGACPTRLVRVRAGARSTH